MSSNRNEFRKQRNKKRWSKAIKCFCAVPIMSMILAGTVILGDNILVDYEITPPHNIIELVPPTLLTKTPPETETNSWNLILVNPWNKLPKGFDVKLASIENGHAVDKRIYKDLEEMLKDARAKGLEPVVCSSFRTEDRQQTLFDNKTNEYISMGKSRETAETMAAKWVAIPGTSEHQTGLAVDIVAESYQHLDEWQENTPEQKWLMENSYKYGFILRYSSDKKDITGIEYEPWHYRYVGKEVANEIYEEGISLEEYLENK